MNCPTCGSPGQYFEIGSGYSGQLYDNQITRICGNPEKWFCEQCRGRREDFNVG